MELNFVLIFFIYNYIQADGQLISKIMQKQIYQKISISECKNMISEVTTPLEATKLNQLLFNLADKIEQIQIRRQKEIMGEEKEKAQILSLVQSKVIQIEERRKLWDLGMADIYNEKIQMKNKLKVKINEMDQLERYLKGEIESIKNQVMAKFHEIQEDKGVTRLIVSDKIEQVKSQVDILVNNKLKAFKDEVEQMSKRIEQRNLSQYKNSFKFVITCEQMYKKLKQKSQKIDRAPVVKKVSNGQTEQKQINRKQKFSPKSTSQTPNQTSNQTPNQTPEAQVLQKKSQQKSKPAFIDIGNNQLNIKNEEIEQKYCKNMQIVLHNMNLLESFQKYFDDSNSIMERFQAKLTILGQKIQKVEDKVSYILQGNPQKLKKQQQNARVNQPINIIYNHQFLNPLSVQFPSFIVEGNKITYYNRTENDETCMILGKQPTRIKNSFCIKIINTKQKYISIGISDDNYQNLSDCWTKNNFIFLRGQKGQLYNGPNIKVRQTGCKFENGDEINVKVNHASSKIQWFVNKQLRATFEDRKISDLTIKWVPLLRFFSNWDSVQYLYQKQE